jgi:hypothetical protein
LDFENAAVCENEAGEYKITRSWIVCFLKKNLTFAMTNQIKKIMVMEKIILEYNPHNTMAQKTLNYVLSLGLFTEIERINTENVKKQYERMFGKKKDYSDNEIFVFNSMRNVEKILQKYED